jgi:hypothetical protein
LNKKIYANHQALLDYYIDPNLDGKKQISINEFSALAEMIFFYTFHSWGCWRVGENVYHEMRIIPEIGVVVFEKSKILNGRKCRK